MPCRNYSNEEYVGIIARKNSAPCWRKQEHKMMFLQSADGQCISHQSHTDVEGTQTHLITCVSMCPLCRQQSFKVKVVEINKKEVK